MYSNWNNQHELRISERKTKKEKQMKWMKTIFFATPSTEQDWLDVGNRWNENRTYLPRIRSTRRKNAAKMILIPVFFPDLSNISSVLPVHILRLKFHFACKLREKKNTAFVL